MYYTNTGHNQLAKNIQALYRTGSNYDLGADALQKAEEWDLEKGRTPMPLGAHANWGGIEYLKTASGWKPVGKHRGHVKANHDIIHHNEDKDKDHAQMVHDAGNMNESEWTKKHGTNLHTKYKAVHDYLHKEKVKKEEKTRNGNPVKQRQHDLATEVVNKLKNGESSQRFITLPDGSKVVEHIQPNKGKDAGSYSRYHMASNRDKSTAVKINGYLTEDEIHHHLRHAFADNAAKIDEQERKDAERFANKKETKPEEKKESREDYLKTAKEDVKNGMDTSAFKEKYGKHEHFDSDDHLMLRNMIASNPRKKEPVKEETEPGEFSKQNLDYSGKDMHIHAPAMGDFPAMDLVLKYDKNNFNFDIYHNGKKQAKISALNVESNLMNGGYQLKDKPKEESKELTSKDFNLGYKNQAQRMNDIHREFLKQKNITDPNSIPLPQRPALENEFKTFTNDQHKQYDKDIKAKQKANKEKFNILSVESQKKVIQDYFKNQKENDWAVQGMAGDGILDFNVKQTGKGVLVAKKTLGEHTSSPFEITYKVGNFSGKFNMSMSRGRSLEFATDTIGHELKQKVA